MVELQLINKILSSRSIDILFQNDIDDSKFHKYKEQIKFVIDHYNKYNEIPDRETFLNKFPDFELLDVKESDDYLIEALKEEDTFHKALPVMQKASELMETDSREAVKYVVSQLETIDYVKSNSIDLVSECDLRYKRFLERQVYKAKMVTFSGFKELDRVIEGFSNDGELAVFFARLNNGKSWVVQKIATEAWKQGRRVGIYSGEMTADKVGYTIDTLLKGFSNRALNKGYEVQGYKEYVEEMKQHNIPLRIITPEDLDGYLTISKLENFIRKYKIEFMVIDQLSLMIDETATKSTQERNKYSNITKGLIRLSKKYQLPIILAVQANREATKNPNPNSLPEMENIAESDAIGQDATLAVSMRIKDNQLEMQIKKYRDGVVGNKFVYGLDLDHGKFDYLADDPGNEYDKKSAQELKQQFDEGKDVF